VVAMRGGCAGATGAAWAAGRFRGAAWGAVVRSGAAPAATEEGAAVARVPAAGGCAGTDATRGLRLFAPGAWVAASPRSTASARRRPPSNRRSAGCGRGRRAITTPF
jgi:hypothetical protein